MKKVFFLALIFSLTLVAYIFFYTNLRDLLGVYRGREGIRCVSLAKDDAFYIYRWGRWQKEFIKGVNLGSSKPGAFPGDLAITKKEYLRWFGYIRDMGANAIRVYTLQSPDFYEALWEFNRTSRRPLYLFHGVWVNEEAIAETMDAFSAAVTEEFLQDIKETINAIHGNASIAERKGKGWGNYQRDISPYVIGWILGIEWEPYLVKQTNENNAAVPQFKGEYLFTETASPFEIWLARAGDFAILYETENYGMQRPLSFVNWPTNDILKHPNEPNPQEDMVEITMEKIKTKEGFFAGLFAAYHIYPYYPDFMFYQREYASFRDERGQINTYRAYLRDLKKEYVMPLLVAEFGIPASRGITHENPLTGFNQGYIDEKRQGEMLLSMLKDILAESYAGGLIFAWQDEWFKRTWNTMELDLPDRRPFWSNVQTNEQRFGLLAFDPGKEKRKVYVDGDPSEWTEEQPLLKPPWGSLYGTSDEEGLYFLLRLEKFDPEKQIILLLLDTLPEQGNIFWKEKEIYLGSPCEFIILLKGKENSRVLVDAYYNPFYHLYGEQLGMLEEDPFYYLKNSGIFRPIYLCLSREIFLPQEEKWIPLQKFETGKLRHGNANPASKEYDSLADFAIRDNIIELRIPWQLINIMDPSTKMIMDDLHKGSIMPIKIRGFHVGLVLIEEGRQKPEAPQFAFYAWEEWETPAYHERLKPSYYILQQALREINFKGK